MKSVAPVQLIVGLGNPGNEYEQTRHNAGVWFINALLRRNPPLASLQNDSKFSGLTGQLSIAGKTVRLLVPTTFMNLSGQSVASLANFYKIKTSEILVVHDELDMPPGVAKFKTGGGHGGQNGLRDIIARMSNQKDFHRLRVGIGHPGDKNLVTGHVLGRASKAEQQAIDNVIDEAVRVLPDAISGDLPKAMNRLHSFKG